MRTFKLLLITIASILTLASSAFAAVDSVYLDSYYKSTDWAGWTATHLGNPINALPDEVALWNVIGVHETAGHTNQLWLADGKTPILDNNGIGTTFASHVDLAGAYLRDLTASTSTSLKDYQLFGTHSHDMGGVNVYQVQQAFTSHFGDYVFHFAKDDLFIAFNDFYGDEDYDDFILRARAATPIPGAAWLLGSGLIGLVGLRRKFA